MSIIPFALPSGIEMTACSKLEGVLCVSLLSTQLSSPCPLCGTAATRIHSHYQRRLADLPSAGQPVRFLLSVRKFFCDVPTCPRKIFAERLAPFVAPGARVTLRLFQIVQTLGLATGGRLGVRVTDRLGIQTSRTTILRRIMALPPEPVEHVIQIGIDDFSFRRGRTFGTIIVDLQTHRVLDVLADRTADTAAAWMATHPKIDLVSRDRGGDYAAAARKAVPGATQTADRFHLLKNLGEALEGVLARHLAAHRNRVAQESRATPLETSHTIHPPKLKPKQAALSQAKREERLAQYQHVVTLRKLGFSQTAIAEQVGVAHSTVSRWLSGGTFPEQQPRPRKMELDAHLSFLRQRWEEGCHNVAELHRELVARGYTHSYWSVYEQLVRFLPSGRKNQEAPDQLPRPPILARQAVFLFLHRPGGLSSEEQATLAHLQSLHSEVEQAYALVQQFAQMLRTRLGEQLDDWLSQVKTSQISELQRFVASVERDKAAVIAGLTLPQNNGIVEGKVNKLKLIKRMGYGRAKFPLLRQRVLHAL
jgi:transposase